MRVGTDCIVIDVEVGMERLIRRKIQIYPLKNQSPNKSMNKKLKSKDEKKNTYRRSFDDKFPGVLGLLKDEKKVGGWEKEFDKQFKITELYMPSIPVYWIKDFIRSLLAQSRQEGYEQGVLDTEAELRKKQEEQNRAERERIIGEVEKIPENVALHFDAIPVKQGGWAFKGSQSEITKRRDYAYTQVLIELSRQVDDILHILKGNHD